MAALIIAIFPQNSSRGNWEEQQDRTDPNSQFELARKPAWLLAFRQFGLPKWKHDFECDPFDLLGNAPQHKFCTAYYNSLRGKCQFFAGGKMSGGKMSAGCICNERLRFLHDVLQGRQVVQNVAGFQGMIGVLIKTERRAVGAGCGGDGGSIAPGVGGA